MKMVIDGTTFTVSHDGRSHTIKVTEGDHKNIDVYGPFDLPDDAEKGSVEYVKAVRDVIKEECR